MIKYDSYKNSGITWITEIPPNWEIYRLGMLGVFSSSGIDKKSNEGEEMVRMVNYTDLIQRSNYYPVQTGKKEYMIVTTPKSKLEQHRLNRGDMVMIPSSESHEDLGYSSLIDFNEKDIVYSYHLIRFSFKKEIVDSYKKYLINNHLVLSQFSSEGKGTTRQIIGRNVLRNVKVVVPPLEEQSKIGFYLDKKTEQIYDLIKKCEKKIELLQEQKNSLVNELVTKGTNPDVKTKDTNIEWIGKTPFHWKICPLFSICEHIKEKNIDEEDTVLTLSYGKLKVRNVEKNFGLLPDNFDNYQRIRPGYVVLRLMDLQNDKKSLRVSHSYLDGIITPVYVSLLCNEKINSEFLYFFLHNCDIKKVLYSLGGGLRQTLRFEELKRFDVVLPPLDEQDEIVYKIEKETKKIELGISREERRVELLKEYKQSLISEVVTGKKRVV